MATNNDNNDLEKATVDEEYLMQVISGEQTALDEQNHTTKQAVQKSKEKAKTNSSKKLNYEEIFLTNRFPSGRNGKVVYIRPEYHERLLRIVQLTREERTTLYSYIDNILEQHFLEYGNEITDYFNNHFKPIL
ncbi:DUF3408 domain-containing protein [Chryseobacterium cucumeris]|uniref:DUF3408 domain-containing protein n=1 Tax=Chryseobacterium cucumeris TaxID=1813611 RepID=A0ABX9X9E1_9FLAO|nr:DUF3408 domain-containing protein [Chryseobacterium cucumeris]MDH5033860.1 DUF3408 domain-containing protein [Chryseobacterium cucumeris]ROH94889.1 DUF3408 domain-containing protein [Chryseobacterium cucumeris]